FLSRSCKNNRPQGGARRDLALVNDYTARALACGERSPERRCGRSLVLVQVRRPVRRTSANGIRGSVCRSGWILRLFCQLGVLWPDHAPLGEMVIFEGRFPLPISGNIQMDGFASAHAVLPTPSSACPDFSISSTSWTTGGRTRGRG